MKEAEELIKRLLQISHCIRCGKHVQIPGEGYCEPPCGIRTGGQVLKSYIVVEKRCAGSPII